MLLSGQRPDLYTVVTCWMSYISCVIVTGQRAQKMRIACIVYTYIYIREGEGEEVSQVFKGKKADK